MLPRCIARRAAFAAMSDVNSFSAATRRSLMPVRVVIHSSEVSTSFSRSALVRTFSGTYEPTETIEQVRPLKSCLARGFLNLALMRQRAQGRTLLASADSPAQSHVPSLRSNDVEWFQSRRELHS